MRTPELPLGRPVRQDRAVAVGERWWIFDRPLFRDPLFVAAMVVGVAALLGIIGARDEYGSAAFVISLATAVPSAVLAVGVTAGSIREFLRGRSESAP